MMPRASALLDTGDRPAHVFAGAERPLRTAFASGGSGGHLYPGLAIARRLTLEDSRNECLFLLSEKAIEIQIMGSSDFPYRSIASRAPQWGQALDFAWKLFKGFAQARETLKQFTPDVLVALGGFASLAPTLAARTLRIPVYVLEQNAVAGRANMLLAWLAKAVFAPFPGMERQFPFSRVLQCGNPIRPTALACERGKALDVLGLDPAKCTLLVLGGSQGAKTINSLVMETLDAICDLRDAVQWIHLTGAQDRQAVQDAYTQKGWKAAVFAYYENMGICYGACDLVISRAGASTMAEIIANGLASVLIPYPSAIRDHQNKNALTLGQTGAACVLDQRRLTACAFATVLRGLVFNKERLERMRMDAKKLYRGDAASAIVAELKKGVVT